ncbi:MAG: hypothetical protein VKP70_04600 [Cyanobacteriota bacterium]|nr:hypothetical protein [Cyanobacteriota bacterium]
MTAPLISATSTTITNSGTTLVFNGFNPSTFPALPAGSFLTGVKFVMNFGSTGGTALVGNANTNPNSVLPYGQFGIAANSQTLLLDNANSTVTLPGASGPPPYPTANITITPQNQSFAFDIWRLNPPLSGTPGNSAAFFSTATVNLPVASQFNPRFSTFFGGVLADSSSYTLSNLPANTYLQYTYDVPAPLPILGGGAAFAWSRRLRRRIAKRV